VSEITRGSVREPTRAQEILALGLRDEKRRRTRQHIAQVATSLFLEHGFGRVTIAEVARTAEVSVNTVYTYFPSKEDLVFYPREASAQRLVRMVADRPPGLSAAAAVLGALRGELRHGDRMAALAHEFGRFLEMARAEPTLAVRLDALARQMVDELAAELATETATPTSDPLPRLVAAQLGWVHEQLFREIAERARAGNPPAEAAAAGLSLLHTVEGLLGDRVLAYATR